MSNKYKVSNIFEVIVQTGASVLPLISKYKLAGWKYKARDVFLTSLSVFRNQEINTFECFHLLLKLIDILGENQDKSLQNLAVSSPICRERDGKFYFEKAIIV